MLKCNGKRLLVCLNATVRDCGYAQVSDTGAAVYGVDMSRGFAVTTQGTVLSAVCSYIFLSFFICDKQHREPSPDVVDVVTRGLFGAVIFLFAVTVRDHGYAQTQQ